MAWKRVGLSIGGGACTKATGNPSLTVGEETESGVSGKLLPRPVIVPVEILSKKLKNNYKHSGTGAGLKSFKKSSEKTRNQQGKVTDVWINSWFWIWFCSLLTHLCLATDPGPDSLEES